MKKKNKFLVKLLLLAMMITLFPNIQIHALEDYYLTDEDVEVIQFEDGKKWGFWPASEGLIYARRGYNANRFYDLNGKIVINEWKLQPYSEMQSFSNGKAYAFNGYIDRSGEMIYPFKTGGILGQTKFIEGIAPFFGSSAKEALGADDVGFINDKLEVIVPAGKYYQEDGSFEGMIPVKDKKTQKEGYLNAKGEIAIPMQYDSVTSFHEGVAVVSNIQAKRGANGEYLHDIFAIDKRGNVLFKLPNWPQGRYSHGLIPIWTKEVNPRLFEYGYYDMTGKLVIDGKFNHAFNFSEGLAAVARQKDEDSPKKYDFINEKGEVVISTNYTVTDNNDVLSPTFELSTYGYFKNGVCLMAEHSEEGPVFHLIDTKGRNIKLDRLSAFKSKQFNGKPFHRVAFSTAIEEGCATAYISYDKEGYDTETVLIKFKNPNMFPPYKVYDENQYHYDKKHPQATQKKEQPSTQSGNQHHQQGNAQNTNTQKPAVNNSSKPVIAYYNKLNMTLNNVPVAKLQSYLINGNSYFKLRDLASLMSDTGRKFSVNWDGSKNLIDLKTQESYQAVGGELAVGDMANKQATVSNAALAINGTSLQLPAYNIANNNYYKLRDICERLGIEVKWNEATKTIELKTE